MKTQFVTDDTGKKIAVLISMKEYKKILDELDELDCIKAYDKAKARKQEFIPAEQVFKQIEQHRKSA